MGIRMTGCTIAERHTSIFHIVEIVSQRAVRHQLMALEAGNLKMFARQLESRPGMIKTGGGLPGNLRVATGAVITQVAAMFVTMATCTSLGQTEKRAAGINLFISSEV